MEANLENNVIQLSPEQILMLEMSDNDIKNGNVIAQDDLDKEDLPTHVIEGIKRGQADIKAGRSISLEKFKKRLAAK